MKLFSMTIPKPKFKDVAFLIIIGILIVALFKQCGKDQGAAIAKINAERDSIVSAKEFEMGALIEARKREATKAWEARNETQIAVYKYDSTRKLVSSLTKTATRLAGEIIDLRDALPDSSWMPVHPNYIAYCDSLADLVDPMMAKINTLEKTADAKDASFAREIKLLNQQNETERANVARINYNFKALDANYEAYKKKVAPHNSLWIGAEAQLSTIYQTVGGQLQWQTKKGIAYKGGVGLISNGGYYVSGGVAFRISLRK